MTPLASAPNTSARWIAERAAVVRGPRGDGARDERDHEGRGIREHVRRVREEREGSRQHRTDDLHDHDHGGDRERDREQPAIAGAADPGRRVVVHAPRLRPPGGRGAPIAA